MKSRLLPEKPSMGDDPEVSGQARHDVSRIAQRRPLMVMFAVQ